MKKSILSLMVYVFAMPLIVGCSWTIDRFGYAEWPYEFIVRDSSAKLYIPIIDYTIDNCAGEIECLAKAPLYHVQSDKLVRTKRTLNNVAFFPTIWRNDGYYHRGEINIDNVVHFIVAKEAEEADCPGDTCPEEEYLIVNKDTMETTNLHEYLMAYYDSDMDFKKILTDIKQVMPSDYSKNTYLSMEAWMGISLYPDGVYIIYPSKEKVSYKSKSSEVPITNIDPSAEPQGYYVSHYRYYPVSDPDNFVDVELPPLMDIENM